MLLSNLLKDKKILITGGAGFIGSNLAHFLSQFSCKIIIIDSLNENCGGHKDNLLDISPKITTHFFDIKDQQGLKDIISEVDYIFNLCGVVNHIGSMNDPFLDLQGNVIAHLSLLEACKKYNRKAKIVFTSTRGVYGHIKSTPVSENAPLSPIDINGIHKTIAEKYHLLYLQQYGIKMCCLRLTNTYGPKHRAKHPGLGIINWWIKEISQGHTISVFGGEQIRDINYVDDVTEALVLAMLSPISNGKIYNLGGTTASLVDIAKLIIRLYGFGKYEVCKFPKDIQNIEIGNFIADKNQIFNDLQWSSKVSLEEGILKTIKFYAKNSDS